MESSNIRFACSGIISFGRNFGLSDATCPACFGKHIRTDVRNDSAEVVCPGCGETVTARSRVVRNHASFVLTYGETSLLYEADKPAGVRRTPMDIGFVGAVLL